MEDNLKPLYDTLKEKGVPTRENCIYLSDGLYITPSGDVVEEDELMY
jgi:hypothetical protein